MQRLSFANPEPVAVLQLIDSLSAGGAEQVAVNIANHLPPSRFEAHLCSTRKGGALTGKIAPHVKWFVLGRRFRLDVKALRKLIVYIRQNDIRILHAHGSSLFIGVVASLFVPRSVVIWHVHAGRFAEASPPTFIFRAATTKLAGVITVSEVLRTWVIRELRVAPDRVWYIPNFISATEHNSETPVLPGKPGKRIVCVANLRPEKDHLSLLEAIRLVKQEIPDVHLLLVGGGNSAWATRIRDSVFSLGLERNVTFLGTRSDVFSILKGCDIGVLSSVSEGFPLALIEYGIAGLPAVATECGQCPEVLDYGKVGLLVPPKSPKLLAHSLLTLLRDSNIRSHYAAEFYRWTKGNYNSSSVIEEICRIYQTMCINN